MTPHPALRRALLAGFIVAMLSCPPAQAANETWDGGSFVNGNWSTITNWNGDTAAPGSTSLLNSTDIATFNAAIANTWGDSAGNPIVIDSASQNIGGLSFTLAAGNYFVGSTGGNTLRLTSGGTIQILAGLTATNGNLGQAAVAAGNLVLGGGTLQYTGATDSTNRNFTLTAATAITIDVVSAATNLTISGASTNTTGALDKVGAGTLTLSGANL